MSLRRILGFKRGAQGIPGGVDATQLTTVLSGMGIDTTQLVGGNKLLNENITLVKDYSKFFVNTDYFVFNKTAYPYTVTYNGTNLYPFSGTAYNLSATSGEKFYFYIDADIVAADTNVTAMSIMFGFNTSFIIKTLNITAGKIRGLFEVPVTTAITNAAFNWGFRNFTKPAAENVKFGITLNSIQLIKLTGHYTAFTNKELLLAIDSRGYDATGNLNIKSSKNVAHSDCAILSDETNFVKTGWFGKKICTYGDSTIAQERWQPYMAARLGCTYTNRGVGGTRVEMVNPDDGNNAQSYTSDTRIATIDVDADAVVVFGGFNDIAIAKSVPFVTSDNVSTDEDWNFSPYNIQGAITLLIRKIRARAPKVKIFIACPPFGFSEISRANLHLIRKAMQEACYYNGVEFIDLYQACQWNYDNYQQYHAEGDTVHFNDGRNIASAVCVSLMKHEPFV